MIDRASLVTERRVIASPIWIQLRDTFTGKPPSGPVNVRLERRSGQEWVVLEHPYRLSNGGDLAFVDLGRSREPGLVGTFDVRVRAAAPGTVAEPDPIELQVTSWRPEAPVVPAAPTLCRFFPGPAYRFPPSIPVLFGHVVESATGIPVARARVFVEETVASILLREEVRTDEAGRFRVPARWSSGATAIQAEKDRPPQPQLAGSVVANLPADLSTSHLIAVA